MPASRGASGKRGRIAERLARTARARFIGRREECSRFRSALAAESAPAVIYVHGIGGVGKTTVLNEFGRIAADAGRPVIALDARHMTPSKRGVLQAFGQVLAREVTHPHEIPVPDSSVVVIDTYERLRRLDAWIRDSVLPHLPSGVLVVLGGRERPAREWFSDTAWAPLTWIIELQNFPAADSTAFLSARGVAGASHQAILDFTHGHPLALSLVADVIAASGASVPFDPSGAPDVIRHLLSLFLDTVPPGVKEALDISAIARVTSERLLIELLGADAGRAAFEWLRAQAFIESSTAGLFPHDLARDVLLAEARWRDPDRFHRLTRRVYAALHAFIASTHGRQRQRLQLDALYVTRTTPTNVSFFDWRALDDVYLEPAEPHEYEGILSLVRRHEGDESAALANSWLRVQPEAFQVCHDAQDRSFGFVTLLEISDPAITRQVSDPAVESATAFVARHAPIRRGEGVVYLRWWMHAEAYQAITAAINLAAMHVVSHCVTRPRLAWNFVTMGDPAFWAAHFAGVNFARVPEADFEIGGRRYGVFAHEWRIDPPADWLMDTRTPMPFGPQHERVLAPGLGQAEFVRAVRLALRDFTSPDRLTENPLQCSRLIKGESDRLARGRALQQLLRQAGQALEANPRDQKLARVIQYTYFEPLATQELVAERLNVPFSTYRHRLGRAIDRIAAWLWQRERAERVR